MIFPAVFLLSLSSLAFEVLLTRVFSISQWNHLSFMVISIALFGFAASGSFLSILDTRVKDIGKRLSSRSAVNIFIILYTFTAIGSFLILNKIPLDYFRLPLEPIQGLYLLTVYLFLALPFFLTGLIISVAYSFNPEKTGFVYFASMTGSACGAIIPALFLPLLGEGRLIIISALIPITLILIKKIDKDSDRTERSVSQGSLFYKNRAGVFHVLSFGIVLTAGFLISPKGDKIVNVNPSPYKASSQLLQFPNTRVTNTATGIKGRIDTIKSRYIRFAPGLSLKYIETMPLQWAAFKDGDQPFTLYRLLSQKDRQFARFMLQYVGYRLAPKRDRVLLIQNGGGSAIICALAADAKTITIVEQHPELARIVQRHYQLPVRNQNPRSFLSQSDRRFHIIHVEDWGTSLPDTAALTQQYLFTVEAFTAYLSHLTENGLVIISRKLLLPPADSIRLWAAAYESLRSLEIKNPETHMVILRNWDTFTLIISARPIKNVNEIKLFAFQMNFDLVYMPEISKEMVNRFNVFDAPYHFLDINRLAAAYRTGTENAFFETHLLDVKPQKDSRPFPSRFLKWSKVRKIYQSMGSRPYSLLMSGEIVVAAVFVEALMVAIFLLIIPVLIMSKGTKKASFSQIVYFLSVGAGFLFVELFFIKEYTLLFGNSVLSFTFVLTAILIFSAVGGFFTQYLKQQHLKITILILVAILLVIFFGLDMVIHQILGFPTVVRYTMAILLLIPLGFLLGIPFPLAMQHLLVNPVQRAYAWTANSCASVLTAIASAQIALSHGIPTILIFAVFSYLLAFLCIGTRKG